MSKCVYCMAIGSMHQGLCREELPPTSEIMPLRTYENIVIKNLIEAKDRRIAELEAEVELAKVRENGCRNREEHYRDLYYGILRESEMKVQTALEAEEGEG